MKLVRFKDFDPMPSKDSGPSFAERFTVSLPDTKQSQKQCSAKFCKYEVDMESLPERMTAAIEIRHSCTCIKSGKPAEVPGTRAQSDSEKWHQSRFLLVTASNAKDAVSTVTGRGKYNLINRLLLGKQLPELKILQYGRNNEDRAFSEYLKQSKSTQKKSGF